MQDKPEIVTSVSRPPIVAVLGHVDHGKTSLLDAIRKTHVTDREAGGITQSIGASSITTKDGNKITFIDTPGHAAFSQMRSQGAKVADIAILVVAATEGPKPQTLEALDYIRQSKASMIVAFTKIDLPSASVISAQTELEKQGVYFEGRGGDVPFVEISNKTGQGVDQLLELISLVAQVNEIKADEKADLDASVIETTKDKRGQLVSVVVRNGKVEIGTEIVAGGIVAKIKSIFDENLVQVKAILPGQAGQILGFGEAPAVGSKVEKFDSGKGYLIGRNPHQVPAKVSEGQLAIYLKTKTVGSMDALTSSLPSSVVVVGSGVGDVNESDVLFAKSSQAVIYCFEAQAPNSVSKLADTEGVEIKKFKVIYELLQDLEEILEKGQLKVSAKAQILASFPYENKKVAGSKVLSGVIKKTDKLLLTRGEKKLGEVKIISMKKLKTDVGEAKAGEELGILFEPQLDFAPGDVLLSIG